MTEMRAMAGEVKGSARGGSLEGKSAKSSSGSAAKTAPSKKPASPSTPPPLVTIKDRWIYDGLCSFLTDNVCFRSSVALERLLTKVGEQETLTAAFEMPIRDKMLDYSTAYRWCMHLHTVYTAVPAPEEADPPEPETYRLNLAHAMDMISSVYDLEFKADVADHHLDDDDDGEGDEGEGDEEEVDT
jgi:hypothetical protein